MSTKEKVIDFLCQTIELVGGVTFIFVFGTLLVGAEVSSATLIKAIIIEDIIAAYK